jgi:hypothetical protein
MKKLLLFGFLFASSAAAAEPMHFQYINTGGNHCCKFIQAIGDITPETPKVFEAFWASLEFAPNDVRLHSQGGDLGGGVALGEIFRSRDITTEVSLNLSADGSDYETKRGPVPPRVLMHSLAGPSDISPKMRS